MSKLKLANQLMKNGAYNLALNEYRNILSKTPELSNSLKYNIEKCIQNIHKQSHSIKNNENKSLRINIGLIGWCITSGNGGMAYDLANMMHRITHWLIPEHPKKIIHRPYIETTTNNIEKIICKFTNKEKILYFISSVDCIVYIQNPCIPPDIFDVISEAKKMNKLIIGIPMWEWWPINERWALDTDGLWAVTNFTNKYLNALSLTYMAHGISHNWKNHIAGKKWGVNLSEFKFKQRNLTKRFAFINGNGGFKDRKGIDLVISAFTEMQDIDLTIYTQKTIDIKLTKNIKILSKDYSFRYQPYEYDDIFIFPSRWEGLCHGIYEAQAAGGIVITSNHFPMDECNTDFLIDLKSIEYETIKEKTISKANIDTNHLIEICKSIQKMDISIKSNKSRENIENNFNLIQTIEELNIFIDKVFLEKQTGFAP